MIPIYEQIQRAAKGEVFYTTRPASNVTSAAARLKRKVKTEQCMIVPNGEILSNRALSRIIRVTVIS